MLYNSLIEYSNGGKNMKTVKIRLSTISDVRDFVNIVVAYDGEVDLISGRYVVDGKSIMGIFSLDLLSPITLRTEGPDADDLIKKLGNYIVD